MSEIEKLLTELCPNGVHYRTLDSLGKFYGGLTGKAKNDFVDGNATFISYKNVYSNPALDINPPDTVKIYDGEKQRTLKYGDVIFTGSSETPDECGFSSVVTQQPSKPLYLNSFCFFFRFDDLSNIDPPFMKHLFRSSNLRYQIKKTASGVTRFNVSKEKMGKVTIPILPLSVQQEIARLLDEYHKSYSRLTEKLTEELRCREKQYEYYHNYLLTQFYSAVEYYTLGEISSYRRGSFPQPYGNKEWYDGVGAMPFVQVADIDDNMHLMPDTKRKISTIAQPKSVFAPKGSIIISLQGSIGRIAITQYDAYIDRTVAIFQEISDKVIPQYFAYQLHQVFSIKKQTARGSTIKTITKEEFTSFSIPVPPIDEQKRIVDLLDRFENKSSQIVESLTTEIKLCTQQYEYYCDKLLTFRQIV